MGKERFFRELQVRLEGARLDDRFRHDNFFARLQPKLEAARNLEIELNKHLAHRFNVLDYLRTDELGLSRIIADLLNPWATHGQGAQFLQTLLEKLGLDFAGTEPDWSSSRVFVERLIKKKRRIDIYVHVSEGERSFCLAVENKPYAGDQENQVKDYLAHLRSEYGDRFLLVYLSPTGAGPSEWSLPDAEIEQWREHLVVMPYHWQVSNDGESDKFEELRARCSLVDWLATCRERSQVERLRWFLKDIELFCQRTFGDHAMTTDSETRAVREYLFSNPECLPTALAVYESWPAIASDVSEKFLGHLRDKVEQKIVEELPQFAADTIVGCKFGGEARWASHLWIYRTSWRRYDNASAASISKQRTSILLEADGKGPNDWCYGVRSPLPMSKMAESDKRRRTSLYEQLKETLALGKRTDWWPQWNWTDARFRNWNYIIPILHGECIANAGEVTDHLVDTITDVAIKAIPIINEIDGELS